MASSSGRMSVSVPPEVQEKLDALAESLDRSRNWVVNQAIEQYLELYEWQREKIQARLDQANSGEATWIPHDEVFDRLEAKIKERIGRKQS
jgi:predicted transcriptional regulator